MKQFLLRLNLLLSFLLFGTAFLHAQPVPPSNLDGQALRTWLKSNWFDGYHTTLGYNTARTEMYGYIDSESGTVYCVYTGFNQPASYTTYLNPINAEHTVPQSWFGSSEPMKSDIHHLFPTHGSVNSARSNHPFDEINDASTTTWYGVNGSNYTTSSSIPSDKDNWSERNGSIFEPREDHKGNVARAVFYYYTMYPGTAGDLSGVVASGDINVLYQWHLDDPVDATEITRNNRTAEKQGNRNPYIDHPDLAARAWGFTPIGGGNPPAAPSLSLAANQSSIDLSWSNVSNETGYKVFKSTDNVTYTQLTSVGANVITYTDNAVSNGTTYYYYVMAFNGDGDSNASNIVSGSPTGSGGGGSGNADDLIFSEYIEGSSFNKALEIANFTGSAVNLSGYSIMKQTNGAGSWGSELVLSGTLVTGEVYVIANSSASATVLAQADLTTGSGAVTFNGNDPVGLFKNGTLIDVIGNFNGGSSNFAKDQTLVRKSFVTAPNSAYTTSEWTVNNQDDFSDLGSHTMDGGGASTCDLATSLSASSITSSTATLSWSTVAGASAYNLRYRVQGTSTWTTVSAASTSQAVSGLVEATTYEFQVQTDCGSGSTSAYSASSTFNTTATPCNTPTGLAVSNVTANSFVLSWNAVSGGVSYDVDVAGTVYNSTTTSLTVAGSPSTTYLCKVRTNCSSNASAYSSNISVTTSADTGGSAEEISFESFENGWGIWNDGGGDCYRYSGSRSFDGSYSIRIRDNSGVVSAMTSDAFNATTYDQIEVEFSFYAYSMELDEDFWVRFYDGSQWNTVKTFARGTDFENNGFYTATVVIEKANYNFASNSQVRFQCDASGNADQIYLDAVTLTGISGSGSRLTNTSNNVQLVDVLEADVSLDEELEDEITFGVYPNPAINTLNIINATSANVMIYNFNGQLVKEVQLAGNQSSIDVSTLKSGIYIIKAVTEEGLHTARFIKK